MFSTSGWYNNDDNNNRYNKYLEFHDIIEWYKVNPLEKEDLLEKEFQDIIPRHNKQEWPEELVIEGYQTMPGEQINLEPFIPYYYYINTGPRVSNKRRRKETKNLKDHQTFGTNMLTTLRKCLSHTPSRNIILIK